jgi:SecD/SecF fusion protein
LSRHLGWRLVAVLLVLGVAGWLAVTRPARLGLDLRGGTQIVLEAKDGPGRRVDGDTVARTLEVLRRRVDQLGVAEPTLQRSGARRVIVELPGVYDPKQAVEVIGRTAQLAFHPVLRVAEPTPKAPTTTTPAAEDELVLADEDGARLRLGPAALTGEAVGDARAELDPQFQARWQVAIEFQGAGGRRWAALTGEAACQPEGDPRRRVAIVLDRQVISSPQVDPSVACGQGITGGQTVITGDFTSQGAEDLALLIRAGALPVPVEVVEQRTIGPTLGDAAITASVQAAVLGAALTMLYMIGYYRLLGGLAAVALVCYGLLSFAVLLALRATLTLPGIAGFVLAIGMAVDANVLVFERMREEHRAGTGLRPALERGFGKAFSAIADSSVTTLLAAGLLFFLASGAVRGFGVTLSVGVVVSLFTALVVTRVLVELVTRLAGVRQRPRLLGLEGGGRLANWLATRGPDLLGRARWWLAGSLLALLLAGAGLAIRGPNFGVEFTGGRLLEYRTARAVDLDAARRALADAGFPRAVVQASGDGDLTVRTGQLDQPAEQRVQRAVAAVGGRAEELRDEFIGPTIGAEAAPQGAARPGDRAAGPARLPGNPVPVDLRGGRGHRHVPRRGHPAGLVRLAGQAAGRGVPGRPTDGDRLLGQRLGGGVRPHPRTPARAYQGAAGDPGQRRLPADRPPHRQYRAWGAVHPGGAVRARRGDPDRLRAGPAGRHPGRHLLLGPCRRAAAGRLRAALRPAADRRAAAATPPTGQAGRCHGNPTHAGGRRPTANQRPRDGEHAPAEAAQATHPPKQRAAAMTDTAPDHDGRGGRHATPPSTQQAGSAP